MRTEGNARSAVYAFDGLGIFSHGDGTDQAGLLATAAAGAEILVKYHGTIRPLLQSAHRAGSGTRSVIAAAACHHTKVAFNSALGLDLDGAVLQRDSACASPAACEHAAQAADAALGMGDLQAATLLLLFHLCLDIYIANHSSYRPE